MGRNVSRVVEVKDRKGIGLYRMILMMRLALGLWFFYKRYGDDCMDFVSRLREPFSELLYCVIEADLGLVHNVDLGFTAGVQLCRMVRSLQFLVFPVQ